MYRNTYDLRDNRHGSGDTRYAQPTTRVVSTIGIQRRPSYATDFGVHPKLYEFLITIGLFSVTRIRVAPQPGLSSPFAKPDAASRVF